MAMFKRMFTEEEINKIAKIFKPGEIIRLYDDKYYPDYAELSSNGLKIDFTKVQGDGTNHTIEIGTHNDSFAITYYEDEEPKGALSINGEGVAIDGVDIYIGNYATESPNSITLAKNPKQPSVEITGDITEKAGSGAKYGTYTLKYIPLLDSNGNVVGGAGTIALGFTATCGKTTLYLTSSNALPNLTGIVKAETGAMSMICVEGASGDASTLTLQGGVAGAILMNTLEGGVNIYSN